MARIFVLNKFEPNPHKSAIEIDTTSNGKNKDLSPFFLGPVPTYEPTLPLAQNFENLWQFAKVYPGYVDERGFPNVEYFKWRNGGWRDTRAHRYPMGKGAKPLFSYWAGLRLDYISARKRIYAPAYAYSVISTASFAYIQSALSEGKNLVLRDFDGYDFEKVGKTLKDVINDSSRPMGHAFVIAMLLTNEYENCVLS